MRIFNREGISGVRLFFDGIFVYFTGYLISASSSFPRELRYQKIKERKRKKKRETFRAIHKGHLDEEKAKECNESYVPGEF